MAVGWGVIGAGGIARRRTIPEGIVPAKNAELVAVMDVAPGVAKEVARESGCRKAYTQVGSLLRNPDVQAVYIAVPVHLHEKLFKRALKAHKHVLVEKPLAGTVRAAQRMADLGAESGLMCTEGYMMKFHAMHQRARDLITAGRLGKVVCIRGQLSCWYPPIENAWRQNPRQGGGGAIMDMATHVYDLMQYLAGEKISEVMAFTGSLVHDYPVEDSSVTLVRFPSGCQGVVEAYFNVRDESCPRRLEIYGSAGGVLADGTIGQGGGTMREIVTAEEAGYDADQKREAEVAAFRDVEVPEVNMYQAEIEYLSDCILNDTPPSLNTLADGVQVMQVASAAYRSAKTGKRVAL